MYIIKCIYIFNLYQKHICKNNLVEQIDAKISYCSLKTKGKSDIIAFKSLNYEIIKSAIRKHLRLTLNLNTNPTT